MLTIEDLKNNKEMASWNDISLPLYKEFAELILLPKTFHYYLETGDEIIVQFQEWAMSHLWAIHHINNRIKKEKLFQLIDDGLDFSSFRENNSTKKD